MDRRSFLLAATGAGLVAAGLAPSAAADREKLTVLLDWFVNPDHAPLIVARERGFFAAAGLDVDLVPPADPSAPPRLVAAGKADLAVSYQPNTQIAVAEGLPLLRVGTLIATPLNCLAALADGPVKTLADLKGRTVGFSVGGFEDALLGAMLRSVGLALSDVTLININFALTPSLVAGKVDAVIGAFRNFELFEIQKAGKAPRAFFPEEHGVPPYDELILVAHRERRGDKVLRRFVDAVERGTLALLNDPTGSWDLIVKAYPALGDDLNKAAFEATLRRFAPSPAALDHGRYERFAAFLQASGLLHAPLPSISDYAIEPPL
jgi:putative hydroxymethylpyrimidine transport system substrate-binding protein